MLWDRFFLVVLQNLRLHQAKARPAASQKPMSGENRFISPSSSLPAAAYYLPRHLAPSPTYPHLYPPYLIRGYPDTAAMENRQTIINDYITSQQMHHNAAATAMAQRADMLRGLSPREPSLALNYAAGPCESILGIGEGGSHLLGAVAGVKQQRLGVTLTALSLLSSQESSTCPKCRTCLSSCPPPPAPPPPPWTASPTSPAPPRPSAADTAAPRSPQVMLQLAFPIGGKQSLKQFKAVSSVCWCRAQIHSLSGTSAPAPSHQLL